jgi:hypothetical protein
MNIKIIEQTELQDGTIRFNINLIEQERIYLGYILESFEGWCNYTTPVKSKPVLQVDVAPDYVNDFSKLYQFLEKWEIN